MKYDIMLKHNMDGLNTYDYGARQYNPVTVRWDRMDPLCEKYYDVSPYAYCHNNPIMLIDLDGKDDYFDAFGKFLFNKGNGGAIYIRQGEKYIVMQRFDLRKQSNMQMAANVVGYYANAIGIKYNMNGGSGEVGVSTLHSTDKEKGRVLAGTKDGNIYIKMTNGHFDDYMYDLANTTDGSFPQALSKLRLNPAQRLQVETEINDLPPTIVEREIKDFLDQLSYPIYFLDFETCQFAIPEYDNSSPYEQIVFQYSLHYIEEEGGELKHTEYLAYPGKDPRRELAETLCRDIPTNVCVLAYNMEFEKGRISAKKTTYMIAPVKEFNPSEIRTIRTAAGMTQTIFACYMGVSKKTVEAWEAGRSHPTGSAFRLMGILSEHKEKAISFFTVE